MTVTINLRLSKENNNCMMSVKNIMGISKFMACMIANVTQPCVLHTEHVCFGVCLKQMFDVLLKTGLSSQAQTEISCQLLRGKNEVL